MTIGQSDSGHHFLDVGGECALCGCGCNDIEDQSLNKSSSVVFNDLSEFGSAGDDFTNTTQTTGRVSVGETVSGVIETVGDLDWFAITLEANQTINISLEGDTLSDPYLRVFDSHNTVIGINDDGGSGLDSFLTFTASTSGTYYIEAGAYSVQTGSYDLEVTRGQSLSEQSYDPIDALTWGTQLADPMDITVYFGTSGYSSGVVVPGVPAVTSEGFNAYERARFAEAFDRLEAVANVNFTVVDTAEEADFRLVLDTNELPFGLLGYFTLPTATGTGNALGVFNGDEWDRSAGGSLEAGGEGFATITHELLHGLGMAHGHDDGGDSDILLGVNGAFGSYGIHGLNQGVYTTQSYNGGLWTGAPGTAPTSYSWGREAGPMALDIAVIQQLYGANTSTALGDDVYTLDSTNGLDTAWESIWDAGGIDEIRHSGSLGATIDLRAATLEGAIGGGGYLSSGIGIAGGLTIANGVVIENATGGDGADVLVGNDSDNVLNGGAGDDTLGGGAGSDRLLGSAGQDQFDGGDGSDIVDYGASRGSLRVDLIYTQVNTNIAAGDTYTDIENLSGSRGSDNLRGTLGDNVIEGQENVDYIYGRRGDDILDGGIGSDVLFGGVGADILLGGEHRDRAQYSQSLEALIIDLMNTSRNTGEAAGDVYDSIEDLAGSRFADGVFGDTGSNRLFGRQGNDRLYGRAGDDYLNGGANNDRLDGGVGNDTLRGGQSADTFVFTAGHDVIEDMNLVHRDRIAFKASTISEVAGLSGAEVIQQFGSVEGGHVVLRFDSDTSLTVQNFSSLAELESNVFVF
ncbi:pre-peptidase C-terminal domain-containing protein [Sulfitobacter sp.]|uniref:M10 family metallopeptidase C-terminal domain-containing protein n=1 Tax=Sulfitobacter sp. TaxID=1903071 RepID=UPI0032973661